MEKYLAWKRYIVKSGDNLIKIANTGDVIYIKGSRGMKMETIIEKGLII